MAQSIITVKLGVKMPWWWRLYLDAVVVAHNIGVIGADPETAVRFVMRHARFYTEDRRGRRKYIRAEFGGG